MSNPCLMGVDLYYEVLPLTQTKQNVYGINCKHISRGWGSDLLKASKWN